MDKNSITSEDERKAAMEFKASYEEFCTRMAKTLDEQYWIVAGLFDVVEGDRGT